MAMAVAVAMTMAMVVVVVVVVMIVMMMVMVTVRVGLLMSEFLPERAPAFVKQPAADQHNRRTGQDS